jgi:hypothetical protein
MVTFQKITDFMSGLEKLTRQTGVAIDGDIVLRKTGFGEEVPSTYTALGAFRHEPNAGYVLGGTKE